MATANITTQTSIFGIQDWQNLYQTYNTADFQSYNFETIRKTFVDYLQNYYPETFNDFTESSEYIALLDMMAFMGQALAFRTDLNTRENFIDTAQRRDSVIKLANLVNYNPKRNLEANGVIKVISVQTTENVYDYQNINLAGISINWNDATNPNWFQQFISIVNASLVNSQQYGKSGGTNTINGVITDEYSINILPGYIPVVPFNATVDSQSMVFEAVSATTSGETFIYEVPPRPNEPFNILYQNDQQGYGSINTGFFFYFKQGQLQNQTFTLSEQVSNWQQYINIQGINNTDVWLYSLNSDATINQLWTPVQSVYTNADFSTGASVRTIYSISSSTNDTINLNFGDGIFGEIPSGAFRTYVRQSNGLTYVINPEEMQNVVISLSYVSRSGKTETITFTCALQQNVSNSQARETIDSIRQNAPAQFYTQNRMVNGEDYNNFPYTQYSSIIKSQAIARSVVGAARNLDLIDPTGQYSSVNLFASDGALWYNNITPTFNFTYVTTTDINNVIINQIQPLTRDPEMLQYYYYITYNNTVNGTNPDLVRPSLVPPLVPRYWNQVTAGVNQCTGYFTTYDPATQTYIPAAIGPGTASNRQYLVQGALVKFVPPANYVFDVNNQLKYTPPGYIPAVGDHSYIWAPIQQVVNDGTAGNSGILPNGEGPVSLGMFVPGNGVNGTSATPSSIIPVFLSYFGTSVTTLMAQYILVYQSFGLTYNNLLGAWTIIYPTDANYNDLWMIQLVSNGVNYTVQYRALQYVFGSVDQCRFFYDPNTKIFDITTETTISDFINVLGTNRSPTNPTQALLNNQYMNVIGQTVEPDGYVNDFNVTVSYTDANGDGYADDPDVFQTIIGNTAGTLNSYVFLQEVIDGSGLERWMLVDPATINSSYPLKSSIEAQINAYPTGQLFYAYNDYVIGTGTTNPITNIARANNVATVTTMNPHNLSTADQVTVVCANDSGFNVTDVSIVVTSLTTFSYADVGTNNTVYNPTCTVTQPAGFWQIAATTSGMKYLVIQTDYSAQQGRSGLYFQYRHNSPNTNRINPGTTNIIDLYVVTNSYYTEYQAWIQDTTGTVTKPTPPTPSQLNSTYQNLFNYKMLTDNVIINSVTFKPLFGLKANPTLQAVFKVVKNPSITGTYGARNPTVVSDQEIQASVIAALNQYFDISRWTFGQTFYFSDLSSYLHNQLGDILSSVVIVPTDPELQFGDLFQIDCAPNEIFVNAATVNQVIIIPSLTSSALGITLQP